MSSAAESAPDPKQRLQQIYERQRAAFAHNPYPSADERRTWLERLERALTARHDDLVQAISEDFGGRSRYESMIADLVLLNRGIRYNRKHLRKWMQPESRSAGLVFAPSRAKVVYQPKGVVGVIAPWNYPVQLAVLPAATALAAGNRVMIKPSELTPRTSALLAEILSVFDDDLLAVVQGGPDVSAAFARLPLDHLLFTGSTHVGRLVMQAATEHLTPVTLELGGKSPAIIHPDYDLHKAATKVVQGKLFNAGQTCIAPDYVLVSADKRDRFVEAMRSATATLYPSLVRNDDYSAIVNDRHRARLQGYLDDARERGATLVPISPTGESFEDAGRKMDPVLVLDPSEKMRVMQEEIFGPILPLVPYTSLEQAIGYVNDHPRPLALYYFDDDGDRVQQILERTHSGDVSVNTCLLHFAIDDLPFGGIGPSGMGAYHGVEGFRTFSHAKSVFTQSRIDTTGLLAPPYGSTTDQLLKVL